jgi:(1->4)-alpha-D-glucan 1-alpha-D-glucosylmutase
MGLASEVFGRALGAGLHVKRFRPRRAAGDRTTWTAPDEAYEAAVHAAVDAAYDDTGVGKVLAGLLDRVVAPGWSNALVAKLVAITMPGVPDVYQGSELWEQSLVDPDNRRFVDFDHRTDLLGALREGAATTLTPAVDDPGAAKLQVTHAALTLRRDRPELFTTYAGLAASGPAADHVLAFDRGGAITVATRLPIGLGARGGWGDTTLALPVGEWRDEISGRPFSGSADVPLAEILADLPVALLTRTEEAS